MQLPEVRNWYELVRVEKPLVRTELMPGGSTQQRGRGKNTRAVVEKKPASLPKSILLPPCRDRAATRLEWSKNNE